MVRTGKLYYLLLCAICFFFSAEFCAQNGENDSLLKITTKLDNKDSNKVNNYCQLALGQIKEGNYDQAMLYAKSADSLLKFHRKLSLDAKVSYLTGMIHYYKAEYKQTTTALVNAVKVYEKLNNKAKVAACYNILALVFQDQTLFDQAEEYHLKCLRIRLELGDSSNLTGSYSNMGLNLYQKAKKLGGNYANSKNVDEAIDYIKKSLELAIRLGQPTQQANAYGNLSNIMNDRSKYEDALAYATKALTIYREIGNTRDESVALMDIGNIYMAQQKFEKAIAPFNEALKLAIENQDLDNVRFCYINLSNCYEKSGDYKQALNYNKQFSKISDSLFNIDNLKQINDLQIKYETDKKENENKLLQVENILSSKELKQQKMVIYAVIGGLLLALTFAVFIFYGLKKQRKANQIISEQKKVVEEKHAQIEIQKELIEEKQKEILDSIHYARRIQQALLAHKEFVDEHLANNFIYFNPKDIVSGDFYWATKQGAKFFLAVCDSTGHGVPGAFMSLLNIGFLSEAINEKNIFKPDEILEHVRNRLTETVSKDGQKDGFDGILITINLITHVIEYAAAHNAPVLVSNGELKVLEADKMPVGVGERKEHFKLHTLDYKPGDMLYLYTDGYADQFGGPKGKKFKYKQLDEILLKQADKNLKEQELMLRSAFDDWKGDLEQVDDVCIIGIRL